MATLVRTRAPRRPAPSSRLGGDSLFARATCGRRSLPETGVGARVDTSGTAKGPSSGTTLEAERGLFRWGPRRHGEAKAMWGHVTQSSGDKVRTDLYWMQWDCTSPTPLCLSLGAWLSSAQLVIWSVGRDKEPARAIFRLSCDLLCVKNRKAWTETGPSNSFSARPRSKRGRAPEAGGTVAGNQRLAKAQIPRR